MAQVAEFEVIHQVRHNGYAHAPGSTLRLTQAEGSRLVQLQVVRPKAGGAITEVADEATIDRSVFLAGIDTATKDALVQFAQTAYGLKLTGTKAEMVAAVLNAEMVAAVLNAENAASLPSTIA